jgi:HD superfamily phosphodiesterase
MHLAELPAPDSEAARASFQIAERYYSPALLNHCIRSYYFAAAAGLEQGLSFDPELLYVASILHDLGLTEPFDSHTMPSKRPGGRSRGSSPQAQVGQPRGGTA